MISQIDLVTAIAEHLEKRGVKSLVPRQLNAVIQAATLIADAVNTDPVFTTQGMTIQQWLASDDTGLSSLFLCHCLTGLGKGRKNEHPLDPSDLGRCIRFLDAFSHLRTLLPRMKEHGPVWVALVEHWDQLETLYREELPSGQAPKTYELMKKIGC